MLAIYAYVTARAAGTNSLVWKADQDQVSADIHGEALWPLLEDIAHQTGWHIFVEPSASHNASVKFRNLPSGEALQKLLGSLNYALVPQTNGPQQLYVFTTTIQRATQRIAAARPKVGPMKHVANQLLVKVKPGTDIDALAKARGAKIVSRNDKLGLYLLEFSDGNATDSALAGLQSDPSVAAVDYNYIFDPPVTPQPLANVPSGAAPLTLNPSSSANSCDPIIGLIDTGFPSLGSGLDQYIMPGTNVTGDATVFSPNTPTHGYAMAQTILQGFSKQQGSSNPKILPINVYGNSETATTWNVALGVQAAVDGGAKVLIMSWQAPPTMPFWTIFFNKRSPRASWFLPLQVTSQLVRRTILRQFRESMLSPRSVRQGSSRRYANYGSFVQMALPGSSVIFMGNQAYVVQGTSSATAYASGIAAGAKSSNCQSWGQIEGAMDQQFPVPQGN